MTEPRSPDSEPIIELTEVVEPSAAGDDEIIELNDVVESASKAEEEIIDLTEAVESAPTTDDNIIELTEVVESGSTTDEKVIDLTEVIDSGSTTDKNVIELTEVVEPEAPVDDDIIDLTEVVASTPAADKAGGKVTAVDSAPPADAGLIDLVDVVDETLEAAAAVPAEFEAVAGAENEPEKPEPEEIAETADNPVPENVAASEAPVFDLFDESALEDAETANAPETELDFAPMDLDIEEAKSEDLFDSLGMKLEPDLQSGEDHDELDFNLSTQELSDAIDLLDAKLAEEPAGDASLSMGPEEALSSSVSQAQVEKALENVIRKMYAEKIDLLLNEAIEKNVSAEIKRLREQLLTDSPED